MNDSNASGIVKKLSESNVKFYKVDVSKRDDCFKAVQEVVNDFGKINHLVNAVAYFGSKVIYEID